MFANIDSRALDIAPAPLQLSSRASQIMYFAPVSIPYYELRNDTYTCVSWFIYARPRMAGVGPCIPGVTRGHHARSLLFLGDIASQSIGLVENREIRKNFRVCRQLLKCNHQYAVCERKEIRIRIYSSFV